MAAEDDTFKIHRDLLIACGWGKEIDVILLLQQGASVRVQDQVWLNRIKKQALNYLSNVYGHLPRV